MILLLLLDYGISVTRGCDCLIFTLGFVKCWVLATVIYDCYCGCFAFVLVLFCLVNLVFRWFGLFILLFVSLLVWNGCVVIVVCCAFRLLVGLPILFCWVLLVACGLIWFICLVWYWCVYVVVDFWADLELLVFVCFVLLAVGLFVFLFVASLVLWLFIDVVGWFCLSVTWIVAMMVWNWLPWVYIDLLKFLISVIV